MVERMGGGVVEKLDNANWRRVGCGLSRSERNGLQAYVSRRMFLWANLGMILRVMIGSSLVLLLWAATGCAREQPSSPADMNRTMAEVQASHVEANAPSEANFVEQLQRDVRAYLATNGLPAKSVKIELLRKGATQSGVSYPKYYIWIRAADEEAKRRIEGAMRVIAIERTRFDITDFTPADSIRSDPAQLASIYPALLIPAIQQHAKAE